MPNFCVICDKKLTEGSFNISDKYELFGHDFICKECANKIGITNIFNAGKYSADKAIRKYTELYSDNLNNPDEQNKDSFIFRDPSGQKVVRKVSLVPTQDFYSEIIHIAEEESAREEESTNDPIFNNIHSDGIVQEEAPIEPPIHTNIPEIEYKLPLIGLLNDTGSSNNYQINHEEVSETIEKTLFALHINCKVVDVIPGPIITCYAIQLGSGVKLSRLKNLSADIQLALAASDIRIEIIPGTTTVGIYVPNTNREIITIKSLISDKLSKTNNSNAFCVGKDTSGNYVYCDLNIIPHLLIAGTTGSGKSVFLHSIILNFLFRNTPDEMKFIMVDTKQVELSVYNGIPHLLIPVITSGDKAISAFNWAVAEMMERYNRFAEFGVKDISSYNQKIEVENSESYDYAISTRKMSRIIIIIDEMADLMMTSQKEAETLLIRLAQMARAAGIHLILATQKPSSVVITPMIKANITSRISFKVNTWRDSQTILDRSGAEELLGNGDMLYHPGNEPNLIRIQGAFVSETDVNNVVDYLRFNNTSLPLFDQSIVDRVITSSSSCNKSTEYDDLFTDAAKLVIEQEKASIGFIQRKYKIGFNRAAHIMDQLCDFGVVGEETGTKPRTVLMTREEFEYKYYSSVSE